jgi:hypothetical protein
MSFRKFGGLQFAPKHNAVASNYNTSNNLLVTQNVGQPNSYINFESDISGNVSIHGDFDLDGNLLVSGNITSKYMFLSSGTNYSDAENAVMPKSYIDLVGSGLIPAGSVYAASSFDASSVTIPYPVNLSSSFYTTLPVVDGITITVGTNILVNDQGGNNGQEPSVDNGVYTLNTNGTNYYFERTNTQQVLPIGYNAKSAFVAVKAGTFNENTGWVQTNTNTVTDEAKVGTDALIFTKYITFNFKLGQGLNFTTDSSTLQSTLNVDSSLNFLTSVTITDPTTAPGPMAITGSVGSSVPAVLDATAGSLVLGHNSNPGSSSILFPSRRR